MTKSGRLVGKKTRVLGKKPGKDGGNMATKKRGQEMRKYRLFDQQTRILAAQSPDQIEKEE